ncbi:MAG: hypothetical protein ACTIJ9_15225 [Aequorivita sp.]
MIKIGIVDDDKSQRETLKSILESHLENLDSKIEVIDIFPFPDQSLQPYASWIKENEIVCLIFDERMHNESENDSGPVGYRGNELVLEIRKLFAEMPIYVITSHKSDPELMDKFSQFEDIIGRGEFIDDGAKYVNRFIRASHSFIEDNLSELSELKELSELAATSSLDAKQRDKLNALQTKLNLTIPENLTSRQVWLEEYESLIGKINQLKADLENNPQDDEMA